jgi:pantoate kinase
VTPEVKVKKKVKEALQEIGAYYAMPVGTGFGNAGVPDFLVCVRGMFIGIECKANGNKPTALQLHHMMQIRKAGGLAYVVDENNVTEVTQILKEKFK